MSQPDAMGLTPEAAAGYEEFFVPAIFHQWPSRLAAIAMINSGHNVLDVGCGTGVMTRALARRVGSTGKATGIDLSTSMLGVARSHCPEAEFKEGDATALPYRDNQFDAALSAFMLMFVPEPFQALSEMHRVLRPGGQGVVSVWSGLADNPIYAVLADQVREVAGDDAATSIAMPFSLGSTSQLEALFDQAGITEVRITGIDGTATFPSLDELVRTEIQAWLLAGSLDGQAIDQVCAQFRQALPELAMQSPVTFAMNAHVASWYREPA